jgi:hypothetical protein
VKLRAGSRGQREVRSNARIGVEIAGACVDDGHGGLTHVEARNARPELGG